MINVAIWGAQDQARLLKSYIWEAGLAREIKMYDPKEISEFHASERFDRILALRETLATFSHFSVGIGGTLGFARYSAAIRLKELGLLPLSFIHNTAFIDSSSLLAEGAQLFPSVTVGKFVTIGEQVIINTSASIDHDCLIGKGVHIMGAAALAGRVTVCDFASVGTNATILPRLTIGRGSVIGAGAVVTKSTQEMGIYAGVPARKIGESDFQFDASMMP